MCDPPCQHLAPWWLPAAANTAGRVERYWGTHHGFAFDDRPAYDAAADDRHWAALLDLFDRNLKR